MRRYFVNKHPQRSGEREVHLEGCPRMPDEENRIPVGRFVDCRDALILARRYYVSVDGCPRCCPDCHGV